MASLYGWGTSAVFTTADPTGGRQYTRFRGPIILGSRGDLATSGASVQAPHIANVSTQRADFNFFPITIGSSSATTNVVGFNYISQSSYTMTSSSGTGSGPVPTPQIAGGVAIMYDPIGHKICVYSTVEGDWLGVTVTSS